MAEKKIVFKGVDAGLSQMFDSIKGKAKEMSESVNQGIGNQLGKMKDNNKLYDQQLSLMSKLKKSSEELLRGMIQDSQKVSLSGRGQVKFIEDQISAMERKNRIFSEGRKLEIEGQIASVSGAKGGTGGAKAASGERDKIDREFREDQLQTKILREMLNAIKTTSNQEIQSDKKSIEKQIGAQRGLAFGARMSDDKEGQLKQALQTDILKEGSEVATKETKGALNKLDARSRLRSLGGRVASAVQSPISALASIPVVGGLMAFAAYQGVQRQAIGNEFMNMTGVDYNAVPSGAGIGVSKTDMIAFADKLASSRGYASEGFDASGKKFASNIGSEAFRLKRIQKSFGLDEGLMLSLARNQSFDVNKRETSGDIGNFVSIMKSAGLFKGGDFSRLAELLETGNQLAQSQSAILESINSDTNAQVISSFVGLGGSFADKRAGARIGTIDNSLRRADNDFKQAFNFDVLRKLNPEATLYELKEMEEKGISQKGFMQESLKGIRQVSGGDKEIMMQMAQARFGLSFAQTRKLVEGFLKDPTIFEGIGDEGKLKGDLASFKGTKGVSVGIAPKMMANISDIAADIGDASLNYVNEKVEILNHPSGGTGALISDLLNDISGGMIGTDFASIIKSEENKKKIRAGAAAYFGVSEEDVTPGQIGQFQKEVMLTAEEQTKLGGGEIFGDKSIKMLDIPKMAISVTENMNESLKVQKKDLEFSEKVAKGIDSLLNLQKEKIEDNEPLFED